MAQGPRLVLTTLQAIYALDTSQISPQGGLMAAIGTDSCPSTELLVSIDTGQAVAGLTTTTMASHCLSSFEPAGVPVQRMITAHHHVKSGIIRHNHRAAVAGTFAVPGSIRVVRTRLDPAWVQAHAWCMVVAFAILFPAGIIWARYFRVRRC